MQAWATPRTFGSSSSSTHKAAVEARQQAQRFCCSHAASPKSPVKPARCIGVQYYFMQGASA